MSADMYAREILAANPQAIHDFMNQSAENCIAVLALPAEVLTPPARTCLSCGASPPAGGMLPCGH